MCVGGWMSFSSVAIPKMMNGTIPGDPIQIDLHVGSWIASTFFIGNVVGCLVGGLINQVLGARMTFILCSPIAGLTWVMIATSHHVWVILLSRIISGFLFGLFQANGKVYNAEISHPDVRGSIGTVISNLFTLGCLYTYVSSYFIASWRTVAWVQLVPCVLLGVSCFFAPNSPYWLVERGREEEARKSLRMLRGPDYDLEEELAEIVAKKRAKEVAGKSVASTLASGTFLRPFLRIGTLMMITQWAGINVITAYMVTIFTTSGSSLDPDLAPILVSCVQQALAMLSTGILRVCPRKPLFLICASLMAAAQFGHATYYYLVQPGENDDNNYGWVPVLSVILLNSFRTIGYMSVVQLLLAESFPTEIRSYASGICGACTAVNMFGATKLYPWFLHNLSFSGTFWMYAGVMAFQVVYGGLSIPENKGQSLVKTEDKMLNIATYENAIEKGERV